MDKLVLIDGYSILHRTFYGIPELTNSKGFHTNAIYGFLNILFKLFEEEQPTHIAVAFDVHHPTFRHELYKEYKGNRKPMPDELREQVPVMKDILKAMNILVVEKPGLEADDILGTLARIGESNNMDVTLVSGDRDLLQIATDKILIRIPKTYGGKTTIENYYAKDVEEAFKVTPRGFIELKALMGDSSDNIPGVPKVGKQTATDLMLTYGSFDEIFAHVDEIPKAAVKKSLIENRDLADLCLKLVTIKTDAELDCSIEDAIKGKWFNDESYRLFKELEFKKFLDYFDGMNNKNGTEVIEGLIRRVDNSALLPNILEECRKDNAVGVYAFWAEGEKEEGGQLSMFEPETEDTAALAIATNSNIYYISTETIACKDIKALLNGIYCECSMSTLGIKGIFKFLEMYGDTTDKAINNLDDVLLGAYLLNPLKNDYSYDDIAVEYLNLIIPSYNELCEKRDEATAFKDCTDNYVRYCCMSAYSAGKAMPVIKEKLVAQGMYDLYRDIELPVAYVLHNMENAGMKVDIGGLRKQGEELQISAKSLEQKIYDKAGKEFNINSPKQLGEILFEDMKLPGGKKTKTGYSTSAEALEKLAPECEFVGDVLEYRTVTKLKSTFVDGLTNFIAEDGRIHSNFNQTITATGRISSTEPNLQNIPTRYELGRALRKVFVPEDGYIYIDADYSQIELRILASLAGDDELISAYENGTDIHSLTASKVFHIPLKEVSDDMRRKAKAVNFGIVYGISSFGLSQDLAISKSEAKGYIEEYFKTYPKIKQYLDEAKAFAKDNGYSVTAYGRRRPIPEMKSSNFAVRGFGERVAMNAPIQGTAADIMKIAMIRVYNRLKSEHCDAKMLLQVHDELIIEASIEHKDRVFNILQEEMQNAAKLKVCLEVSANCGNNWYEAK